MKTNTNKTWYSEYELSGWSQNNIDGNWFNNACMLNFCIGVGSFISWLAFHEI